jgi:hypothetical protein
VATGPWQSAQLHLEMQADLPYTLEQSHADMMSLQDELFQKLLLLVAIPDHKASPRQKQYSGTDRQD